MKSILTALLFLTVGGCATSPATEPGTGKGEVLGYYYDNPTRTYIPFSNDGTGDSAVLATEKYVADNGFNGVLNKPLDVAVTGGSYKTAIVKHFTTASDAEKTLGAGSQYLRIGGGEWGANSYRGIGFGYMYRSTQIDIQPVFVGYQERNSDGATSGDFIVATRNSTSAVEPTVRLRVTAGGQAEVAEGYAPVSANSLTNKAYVDAAIAAAVAKIKGE